MSTLTHWHSDQGSGLTNLAEPPTCCANKLGDVIDRIDHEHGLRLDAAVRDERVRIVTEALAAIRAYSDAAQSVLDDPKMRLMVDRAAEKCADAIRKVGCICPQIEVTSFGGPTRYMPGWDPRCGMHDTTDEKTEPTQ